MKIEKFVKKPIPVEMVQITEENIWEVAEWCGGAALNTMHPESSQHFIRLNTREGEVQAYQGDFIARGIEGEFYPIGKEIHEKTYDKVEDK